MKKILLLLLITIPFSINAQSRDALAGILSNVSKSNLNKTHDDISGITWHTQKHFKHYADVNAVSASIGEKKGEKPWVVLEMSYVSEDWLFFKNVYLSYDGNTMEVPFDEYANKKTDIIEGGIVEWISVMPDMKLISFLEDLGKSPNAKVRYSGKYIKDRRLSSDERKGLVDVAQTYKSMIKTK